MKKYFFAVALVFAFRAEFIEASEVQVSGVRYETMFDYNTKTFEQVGSIKIRYINHDLSWGTRVFLLWGERCNGISHDWSNWKEELRPVDSYTWEITIHPGSAIVDHDGRNRCSNLEFAFMNSLNNNVSWDNGGASSMGFYSVPMPTEKTLGKVSDPSSWEVLPVSRKSSGYDY